MLKASDRVAALLELRRAVRLEEGVDAYADLLPLPLQLLQPGGRVVRLVQLVGEHLREGMFGVPLLCDLVNRPGCPIGVASPDDAQPTPGDGRAAVSRPDLASGGFGHAFGVTRTWSNDLEGKGLFGHGWGAEQLPYAVEHAGGDTDVVSGGTSVRRFNLDGVDYVPAFFGTESLTSGPGGLALTDSAGNVLRLHDFDAALPAAQRGRFLSFTDAGGNVTSAVYDPAGRLTLVERGGGTHDNGVSERYTFNYNGQDRVSSVTLWRSRDGGGTGGAGWQAVRSAHYTYYGGGEAHGRPGDLKTAAVHAGGSSSGATRIDRSHYRYDAAGNLTMIVGPEAYERAERALQMSWTNVLWAGNTQLAPFADEVFAYDAAGRVVTHKVQGAGCSSCTGGIGTFTFAYQDNTGVTSPADPTHWARRTTMTHPDGHRTAVYTNAVGQPVLEVFQGVTGGTVEGEWATFRRFDAAGRLVMQANPSAVLGYDEAFDDLANFTNGNFALVSDDAGLVTRFDYHDTTDATPSVAGGAAGFLREVSLHRDCCWHGFEQLDRIRTCR